MYELNYSNTILFFQKNFFQLAERNNSYTSRYLALQLLTTQRVNHLPQLWHLNPSILFLCLLPLTLFSGQESNVVYVFVDQLS